jgi:hypothetical protein
MSQFPPYLAIARRDCDNERGHVGSVKRSVSVGRILVIAGVILVVIGLAWPWLSRLPFGRLPGDIMIDRPDLKVYVPITTMIVISIVLSLLLWLFRR